VTGYKGLM